MLKSGGYRYDFSTKRLTKVGAFYVKSYPANAFIHVDGVSTRKTTPDRILNLIPGEHTLAVALDGFQTWTKKLEVRSGETTFAQDIVLFRNNPPYTQLSQGGTGFITSRDKRLYLFLDAAQTLHITNTATGNHYQIQPAVSPIRLLSVSPAHEEVIMEAIDGFYILNLNTERTTKVKLPVRYTVAQAEWDRTVTTVVWLRTTSGLVLRYDLITHEYAEFLSGVENFLMADSYMTTLSDQGHEAVLKRYSYGSAEPVWEQRLTTNEHNTLSDAKNAGLITIMGEHTVWLVHEEWQRSFNASSAEWHGDRLLLANDFEILMYDYSRDTVALVDRTADRVEHIQWHPSGSYFLRQLGSEIQLAELDGRDMRNVHRIGDVSTTTNIYFDPKGERMFSASTLDNGVFDIQ